MTQIFLVIALQKVAILTRAPWHSLRPITCYLPLWMDLVLILLRMAFKTRIQEAGIVAMPQLKRRRFLRKPHIVLTARSASQFEVGKVSKGGEVSMTQISTLQTICHRYFKEWWLVHPQWWLVTDCFNVQFDIFNPCLVIGSELVGSGL